MKLIADSFLAMHFFAMFPGFIPKKIQQALWLESRIQPPGVEAELAAMGTTRAFPIEHSLTGMQSSQDKSW
jgi:hypothetical protein